MFSITHTPSKPKSNQPAMNSLPEYVHKINASVKEISSLYNGDVERAAWSRALTQLNNLTVDIAFSKVFAKAFGTDKNDKLMKRLNKKQLVAFCLTKDAEKKSTIMALNSEVVSLKRLMEQQGEEIKTLQVENMNLKKKLKAAASKPKRSSPAKKKTVYSRPRTPVPVYMLPTIPPNTFRNLGLLGEASGTPPPVLEPEEPFAMPEIEDCIEDVKPNNLVIPKQEPTTSY